MKARELVTNFLEECLVIPGDQSADVLAAWTGRDCETIADAQALLAMAITEVGAQHCENYMLLFGAWLARNKPQKKSQQ